MEKGENTMYQPSQHEQEQLAHVAHVRKSHSARCGHVKRRILAGEPLKGKTLAFALELLESQRGFSDGDFLREMARKLEKGIPLTEYEEHIMVDVVLVHSMLKGNL